MAYGEHFVARFSVCLAVAGVLGVGCASIIGADDYKVAGGGTPGAGGSTGTAGSTGAGGTNASTCSGANPAGQAMCAAGQTCNTDSCGPPVVYACFQAGNGAEGTSCITKA